MIQACIDLSKNVLRINNEEVAFLPEHELPDKARLEPPAEPAPSAPSTSAPSTASAPSTSAPSTASAPLSQAAKYPEHIIKGLTDLGVSRPEAIAALDACQGNPDMAASLLFQ